MSTTPRVIAGLRHSLTLALRRKSVDPRPPDLPSVAYREPLRGVPPLVDVYRPTGDPPAGGYPSALVLHGGAFLVGHRRHLGVRFVATRLAAAGFVVGCADYRLLFRGGPLRSQLDDVAALRTFWRGQAGVWSLDPGRISVVGLSAGGSLSVLDAASVGADYHRLVSVYGLYDFTRVAGPGSRVVRAALLQSFRHEDWAAASPLAVAHRITAPTLLLHGTADDLVPFGQAERLLDARVRAGLPTELLALEGQRHSILQDPSSAAAKLAADRIADFLGGVAP